MKLSNARILVTESTTILGRDVLNALAEAGADPKKIVALEPGRPGNEQVSFGEDHVLTLQSQEQAEFKAGDIVLHTGHARDAAGLAKKVTPVGGLFIDGSGTFAMDPDTPLIVPEVNGAAIATMRKNTLASPNSLSIFLSLALNPLHLKAQVKRVVVSTYQSVSHWGREAQDELFNQTKALFMTQNTKSEYLPKQIAFNCYPMQGHERDDGFTETEWQTIAQVKKILSPGIKMAVNTVTVPAFVGDGMMVNVECVDEVSPIKAGMWMTGQKGLGVVEDTVDLPTHADVAGEDYTYVARLRDDFSVENGLSFWLIGDNLRKGSAKNMVDIVNAFLNKAD